MDHSRLSAIKEELLASQYTVDDGVGSDQGSPRVQEGQQMHLSRSQGRGSSTHPLDMRKSYRNSNVTVSASDEDSDDDQRGVGLELDKNNNVIFRTGVFEDQSSQESLDLNRFKHLPQARWRMKDDSDSHFSDAYTVRGSMMNADRSIGGVHNGSLLLQEVLMQ